jgi:hypothetical protein
MDVFETDDHTSLTSNGSTVSKPCGFSSHQLADVTGVGCFGVRQQIPYFDGEQLDSREIAERKVDPLIIIVDGFRQMDDLDSLFGIGQRIHDKFEFCRRRKRVITADGNECVNTQRAESLIDGHKRTDFLGVFEVHRRFQMLARIDPCGSDADSAGRSQSFVDPLVQPNKMFAFFPILSVFVLDEGGVAVFHAINFDACAGKA